MKIQYLVTKKRVHFLILLIRIVKKETHQTKLYIIRYLKEKKQEITKSFQLTKHGKTKSNNNSELVQIYLSPLHPYV